MKNIKMTDRTMKLNLANKYVDEDVIIEAPDVTGSEGGSASVVVPPKMVPSGPGTPIPSSGYVDKIYFNTSMSAEEVLELVLSNM